MRLSPAIDLQFPTGSPGLVDLVTALLDDCAPSAIHETGTDEAPAWRVYFGHPVSRDETVAALTRAFAAAGLTVTAVDIPDEDWAARSQASLLAVRVGRIVVAPPWDVPQTVAGDVLVLIQPSMGFGTGHHETTRLCLALLQEIDCSGRRALDVGTGSGVLALTAAALGACVAEGIDVDPDAVANARENLALNPSLSHGASIRFSIADLRPARPEADASDRRFGLSRCVVDGAEPATEIQAVVADIVLANLTGALLVTAAPDLLARAGHGASLILSGFQHHEVAAVVRAYERDADQLTQRSEGDWQAALFRRR